MPPVWRLRSLPSLLLSGRYPHLRQTVRKRCSHCSKRPNRGCRTTGHEASAQRRSPKSVLTPAHTSFSYIAPNSLVTRSPIVASSLNLLSLITRRFGRSDLVPIRLSLVCRAAWTRRKTPLHSTTRSQPAKSISARSISMSRRPFFPNSCTNSPMNRCSSGVRTPTLAINTIQDAAVLGSGIGCPRNLIFISQQVLPCLVLGTVFTRREREARIFPESVPTLRALIVLLSTRISIPRYWRFFGRIFSTAERFMGGSCPHNGSSALGTQAHRCSSPNNRRGGRRLQ